MEINAAIDAFSTGNSWRGSRYDLRIFHSRIREGTGPEVADIEITF